MSSFPLSQKYIDFINTTNVSAEFLEGTTASGKTTVGAGVKFMRMVSQSSKKIHAIAAKTTGKAEETIIQQDNGILDLHRNAVTVATATRTTSSRISSLRAKLSIFSATAVEINGKWYSVHNLAVCILMR